MLIFVHQCGFSAIKILLKLYARNINPISDLSHEKLIYPKRKLEVVRDYTF